MAHHLARIHFAPTPLEIGPQHLNSPHNLLLDARLIEGLQRAYSQLPAIYSPPSSQPLVFSNCRLSSAHTLPVNSSPGRPSRAHFSNSLFIACSLASRSSTKFSTSASGIMGSLGDPNSSLPWCERIRCTTSARS